MTFHLAAARDAGDLAAAAGLFRSYAEELGEDLTFQSFEDELARLPGDYAPPAGEILLARLSNSEIVGCVAVRPMAQIGTCEMKRMYVAPAGRGQGVGRALVTEILRVSRERGYQRMVLDTLPRLAAALKLYEEAGFQRIDAYYANPLPDVIYLQKELARPR